MGKSRGVPPVRDLTPMMAVSGEPPRDERGWAVEFKWDGVRALTEAGPDLVQVISRNGRDVTATYPELGNLRELVGRHRVLVDGEIVTLDRAGRPDFGELQSRMHVARPTQDLLNRVPVAYYVFDLLGLDGRDLMDEPYERRRSLLTGLGLAHPPGVLVPDSHDDLAPEQLLEIAGRHDLEGIVAKRTDSPYRPGRRSQEWIKTPLRHTQEVVVGGWREGEGARAGTFGSLLLGVHSGRGLVYIGHVGTGFTESVLRDLHRRLRDLETGSSPFADRVPREHARGARWVRPVLVGEVEHRQWTPEGRLRQASWRGLRPDKEPEQVHLDQV